MRAIVCFAVGLAFGIGLCLSGMTEPAKVLGFLDLAGPWDPSLAFVMGGAVAVALPAFALAKRRRSPSTASRCGFRRFAQSTGRWSSAA